MTELDYVLIRENKSHRKPVLWYFLRSAWCLTGYGCLHSTVTFYSQSNEDSRLVSIHFIKVTEFNVRLNENVAKLC